MSQTYFDEIFGRAGGMSTLETVDDYKVAAPSFLFTVNGVTNLTPRPSRIAQFAMRLYQAGHFKLYPEGYIPKTETVPDQFIYSINVAEEGADVRDAMQFPAVVDILSKWSVISVSDLGFEGEYTPNLPVLPKFNFGKSEPAI